MRFCYGSSTELCRLLDIDRCHGWVSVATITMAMHILTCLKSNLGTHNLITSPQLQTQAVLIPYFC